MQTHVDPRRLEASPGEAVSLTVDVFNARDIIDGYHIELDGLPDDAWQADPPSLSLFPETSGQLILTLVPPATMLAGEHELLIRVVSATDGDQAAAQVALVVRPSREAALVLTPESVTAGWRARFAVSAHNRGNVPLQLSLSGHDQEGRLRFQFEPQQLAVPPGGTTPAVLRIRGRRPFLGAPKARILTVRAAEPGPRFGGGASAVGTFIQRPLVPRGLLVVAAVLTPVAILGAVLATGVDRVLDAQAAQAQAEQAAAQAAQAAIDNAPAGTIQGRVHAGDEPLPDVTVALHAAVADAAAPPAPDAPLAATTTQPDGTYLIEGAETPGSYRVVFARAGYAPETVEVVLEAGKSRAGVDATLRALDGVITGVVTAGGEPVAGATVRASDGPTQVETTTSTGDPVGVFTLTGLPTPATYTLTAARGAEPPVTSTVTLAAGQQVSDVVVELVLQQRNVSGTVRDDRGQPLGGVTVTVRSLPGAAQPAPAPLPAETAGADGDALTSTESAVEGAVGFYLVSVPAPGSYLLVFERDGYVPVSRTLSLGAEDVGDFDAELVGRASLVGTVSVVARTGACEDDAAPCPLLPGVRVVAEGPDGERRAVTADQPAGAYALEDLTPGAYSLTFTGDERFAPLTRQVRLEPGERHELPVELEGVPGAVRGRAPQGLSDMFASCEVVLLDEAGTPLRDPQPVVDGFLFDDLATPDGYRLRVLRDGEPVGADVEVVLGPGERHDAEVDCGEVISASDGGATATTGKGGNRRPRAATAAARPSRRARRAGRAPTAGVRRRSSRARARPRPR